MAIVYTQTLDLQQNKIQNLGSPSGSSDAVNKQYVDSVATGLVWKETVRVTANTNVDLANPGQIDGVTLQAGDRVLLMGQTDATQNGIYVFDGAALGRAPDADTNAELRPGTVVSVSEGTTLSNRTYVLITDGPVSVGTTPQTWAVMNANTVVPYVEGNGIDITNFTVTAVPATNGGIGVSVGGIGVVLDPAGGLDVDATGVKVVPKTDTGIAVDATGVSVVTDTAAGAMTVGPDGIAVVPDPAGGLEIGAAGIAVAPYFGVAVDANGVAVAPTPNKGIASDATGVSVVLDAAGGLAVDAAGVKVVPKTDAGIVVDATGVSVELKPNSGLTVDANGLAVTPGNGVVLSAGGLVEAKPALNGGLVVDATGSYVDPGLGIVVDANGVGIDTTVVARRVAASVGDGTATSIDVVHNLNTRDVQVDVYSASAPYDTVYTEVQRLDVNTVRLVFGAAPTASQYRCVVVG